METREDETRDSRFLVLGRTYHQCAVACLSVRRSLGESGSMRESPIGSPSFVACNAPAIFSYRKRTLSFVLSGFPIGSELDRAMPTSIVFCASLKW